MELAKTKILKRRADSAPEETVEVFGQGKSWPTPIPRLIWTYWDRDEIPLLVESCINSMRKFSGGAKINVLTPKNLMEFIDEIPDELGTVEMQKKSDWIRLYLLNRYGGIWLDATIVLGRSLEWVWEMQSRTGCDYLGFYRQFSTTQKMLPIVDSWFMAAAPDSPCIALWFDVFHNEVILKGTSAYLRKLSERNLARRYAQGIDAMDYYAVHVAGQQALQENMSAFRATLIRIEDSAFFYQERSRWNRFALHKDILFQMEAEKPPSLVKLCGGDRKYLQQYLEKGLFCRESLLGKYVE